MLECVGCPRLLKYVVVSQHLSAYTASGLSGLTTTQLVAVAGGRGLAKTSNLAAELQIKMITMEVTTTKATASFLVDIAHCQLAH